MQVLYVYSLTYISSLYLPFVVWLLLYVVKGITTSGVNGVLDFFLVLGLQRCGKSCRLRWTNYLRPDIKRGRFSFEEEETIIQLHGILGNKYVQLLFAFCNLN